MKKIIYACVFAIVGCSGVNTPFTKQQDPAPPATGWVAYPYSSQPASGPVMVNQVGTVTPNAPTPNAPVPSAPSPAAPNPVSPIGPTTVQNSEAQHIVDKAQVPVQHVTPASEAAPASQPKAPTATEAAQQQSKPPPKPVAAPAQESPSTYDHKYVGPQYDYKLIEKQAETEDAQPKQTKHYAHEHTQTRRRYSKHPTTVEATSTHPSVPEAHTNTPAPVTDSHMHPDAPSGASTIEEIKAHMFKN